MVRSHAQIDRQLNHDAGDGQISRPAAVASSHQRAQRPSSLLAVAGERQIAGDAPPAALRRIPQIPIDAVLAARGFVHGWQADSRAAIIYRQQVAKQRPAICPSGPHAYGQAWEPKTG
jgi:hypothetical protein